MVDFAFGSAEIACCVDRSCLTMSNAIDFREKRELCIYIVFLQ
jgi:hypothetical protein